MIHWDGIREAGSWDSIVPWVNYQGKAGGDLTPKNKSNGLFMNSLIFMHQATLVNKAGYSSSIFMICGRLFTPRLIRLITPRSILANAGVAIIL